MEVRGGCVLIESNQNKRQAKQIANASCYLMKCQTTVDSEKLYRRGLGNRECARGGELRGIGLILHLLQNALLLLS